MKRRTVLVAGTALGASLGLSIVRASVPLKVAFVYVTPIGDSGWSYQHELGRLAVDRRFGSRVSTRYVENVSEGAEAERVIRELAADGNGLIFTTSFGYMNPTIKVAKQFPDVSFVQCSGYKRANNVSTYLARFYEGRYLAGMVAGAMTKSNVGGHVAAFPIPEVIRGINAFTLGMRAISPEATHKVIFVNSWYDPGREREAGSALIAQGADVLTQHTDSTAVVRTAQDKGVWAVAYHSDMSKYGPDSHLTASVHTWDKYYIDTVQKKLEGSWASSDTWGGINDGMVAISPISSTVPMHIRRRVRQAYIGIRDGKLHPFAKPLYNQSGEQIVGTGEHLSDNDLLKMDYYVQGIQGKLPS